MPFFAQEVEIVTSKYEEMCDIATTARKNWMAHRDRCRQYMASLVVGMLSYFGIPKERVRYLRWNEQEENYAKEDWRPRCAICKQSVNLTESKADEYGRAVHENCYVSMLVSKKPRRFTVRSDTPTRAAVATVPPMGGRPLSKCV